MTDFTISSEHTSQVVLLSVMNGIAVKDLPENNPLKRLQKMLSF